MFVAALFIDIYTIARHGNNLSIHQWMNKENVDTHTHTHTHTHMDLKNGILFCLKKENGSASKESTYNVGDLGLISELGRSLDKGKATYSSILAWKTSWMEE